MTAETGADAPDVARLKRMVEEARDLTQEARTQALIDQDYYDGAQWTAAERAALRARRQPDIVVNRIKPAVNGIIGVAERGRSEPRAFPRTPKDEDAAAVATDVIRYIADRNRFHRIKTDCFFDMLTPGTMAALVGVDGDGQVEVAQVRFEEFFADPRSRRRDFKDARYLGVAKWMYADDLAGLYPDKAGEIQAAVETAPIAADASFQDRPNDRAAMWCDRRRRRLMVVELYHREGGGWRRAVFHGQGVLEARASPYHDAQGRPDCPIEAQSAYVDRNNARYGVVRDMRGPQDEINKRRSKLLHLISVSQVEATDPASVEVNADTARAEAARPDGVIPFGWRKVSTADVAAGQAQLLAEAKMEIERMGPNPAVLGRSSEDASGRALLTRQQAGLVELALLYGGLEDWELRIHRQCWARARQFWRAPQFIRVTGEAEAPRFVQLNEPVGGEGAVLGYRNAIAEMDVDIILETSPDVGTLAQEQFSELARLAGANPAWAGELGFEAMIEMSSIPRKRQILETLKGRREAAAQGGPNPAVAIAQAQAAAQVEKLQSEARLNEARAQATLMAVAPQADAPGASHGPDGAGREPS